MCKNSIQQRWVRSTASVSGQITRELCRIRNSFSGNSHSPLGSATDTYERVQIHKIVP